MFSLIKRLSVLLLTLALTVSMLNIANLASPVVRAAQNDGSTRHGARLASPAVVRIITQLTGKVIFTSPDGRSIAFPLKGGTYSLVYSGSGAFINPDGYVLTADHVVDFQEKNPDIENEFINFAAAEYASQTGMSPEQATKEFVQFLNAGGKIDVPYQVAGQKVFLSTAYTGPVQNVAQVNGYDVTRNTDLPHSTPDKQDVAIVKVEAHDMPFLTLASASSIQVQDSVTAIAFPGDADVDPDFEWLLAPTQSNSKSLNDLLTPSIENGQVTAAGKQLGDGTSVYETNNIANHGSSGGPVINNQGQIIGFVDRGSERVVFLIPGDIVVSYMKQAGITGSEKGAFMSLWTKAINEYDSTAAGHWTQAYQDLKKLHEDYPAFGAIQPLIKTAQEKAATEPALSGGIPTTVLLIAGATLLLMMIGGVLSFVFLRRRKRPQPQPSATAASVPAALPVTGSVGTLAMPVTPGDLAPSGQAPPAVGLPPASSAASSRKCTSGHVVIDPKAHFCPECGAPIVSEVPTSTAV